jgi:hypothetical protein
MQFTEYSSHFSFAFDGVEGARTGDMLAARRKAEWASG